MNYEARGVWHNRGFTTQRCDWYAVNHGNKTYAFHEWTFFPHFGEIMAAALRHEQAKDRTEYWLEGWAQNAEDLVELIRSVGLDHGKYRAEECKYGPGVFPVCTEFDDAVKWVESVRKKERHYENDQRPH